MRARRRHKRKIGYNRSYRPTRQETVYVQSPCGSTCDEQTVVEKSEPKKSTFKGSKSIFERILGSPGNDDLILIVLIVLVFLSRRNSDSDCEGASEDNKTEFSVTDFLSKASDILNKFNDNDILLIALLYILL